MNSRHSDNIVVYNVFVMKIKNGNTWTAHIVLVLYTYARVCAYVLSYTKQSKQCHPLFISTITCRLYLADSAVVRFGTVRSLMVLNKTLTILILFTPPIPCATNEVVGLLLLYIFVISNMQDISQYEETLCTPTQNDS